MFEKYEAAYRYLYEDQLEAAEEDYREEFEARFDPDAVDWEGPSCKGALLSLLNELGEDRLDFEELVDAAGLEPLDLRAIGYVVE